MDKSRLIARLKIEEGVKLTPYRDSLGVLTIGCGHNLETKPISMSASDQILSDDIDDATKDMNVNLPWAALMSDNRQMALLDMIFQIGINGVMKFTNMLVSLQRMDYQTAYQEALNSDWAKQTPSRAKGVALLILNG